MTYGRLIYITILSEGNACDKNILKVMSRIYLK